jgi:predicted enzyme involved in methoxymalonyl-ACP biosynthesis
MGRRVEETMVHLGVEAARSAGVEALEAHFQQTKKNKPCLDFWKRSGLAPREQDVFRWEVGQAYALPTCIRLDWRREDP